METTAKDRDAMNAAAQTALREYALCAGLEALLTHTDEAGYRAQIDALRQVYRGMDRAGTD
jgi:hypothetical protein